MSFRFVARFASALAGVGMVFVMGAGAAFAEDPGKHEYMVACAGCHGESGKGFLSVASCAATGHRGPAGDSSGDSLSASIIFIKGPVQVPSLFREAGQELEWFG